MILKYLKSNLKYQLYENADYLWKKTGVRPAKTFYELCWFWQYQIESEWQTISSRFYLDPYKVCGTAGMLQQYTISNRNLISVESSLSFLTEGNGLSKFNHLTEGLIQRLYISISISFKSYYTQQFGASVILFLYFQECDKPLWQGSHRCRSV